MEKSIGIKISAPFSKEEQSNQIGWAIREYEKTEEMQKKTNISENEVSDTFRSLIGNFFKEIREKKKLTYHDVSENSNLSIEQIKNIESGKKEYSIDLFFKMCNGLDCYFFLKNKDKNHLNENHFLKKMKEIDK